MSREKQGYADNLLRIREAFPGVEMLRISQIAKFLGVERHTAARKIARNKATNMVSVADFARQISV